MIILHGTYDSGKIEIKEKNLPQIKTEVDIVFPEDSVENLFPSVGQIELDTTEFKFDREKANAR
ncbi:MAG: hypothetical protein HPY53_11860 [Brevinematales bacterium]|nr:hypothetical protein [Brevinematales bacterium]